MFEVAGTPLNRREILCNDPACRTAGTRRASNSSKGEDMRPLPFSEDGGWNPYLAGALSGIVSVLSVWISGNFLGASTTFVRSAGLLEQFFAPERVEKLEYFVKTTPKIDWQWMFVVGIFIGALIAAVTSKSFRWQGLPAMWQERFGPNSHGKRAVFAFAGGTIAMFGARLADG